MCDKRNKDEENIWLSFGLNSLCLSLSKMIAISILDRLSDKAVASRNMNCATAGNA